MVSSPSPPQKKKNPLGLQPLTNVVGAGFFFFFFINLVGGGGVDAAAPNPITGTEQCLQQGINPTAHSPCSNPGGQRRAEERNQDFLLLLAASHLRTQVRGLSVQLRTRKFV